MWYDPFKFKTALLHYMFQLLFILEKKTYKCMYSGSRLQYEVHTCFFRTKLFAFIYNVPWCLFPSMSFSLKCTFCFPQKWKTFFFQYINSRAVKPLCVCVFWIKIVKYFKDFVLLWMFTIGQCLSTCRYCMPANVWFSVTLC